MTERDWLEVSLGSLIDIKHGWPFASEFFSDELTGRPIVVAIGNFNYTGGFRFESTSLKEYRGDYPKEYELDPNDILLVMTCQTPGGEILGIPGRVPKDGRTYLHNQRMGRIVAKRPDLTCDEFLYYVFLWKEFNQELVASATGTKIVHTAPSRITAFRFLLPPLDEQRRIAAVLGAIDEKIGLNREMNRKLEAFASILFKSWFVDFDPVVAKRDGKTPVGVPADALDLFPSHFEDCALGPIPRGWTAGRVDDQFSVVMGQSPPGSTYNQTGEGLPFYQGRTDFGFRFPTRRVYCTAPTRMAEPMDALISVRAPVGDVNMAAERCAIGRGVAAVRHKAGRSSFGYYAMQSLRDEFDVYESEGTLFGAIGGAEFRSLRLTYPSEQILNCFESIARPLDDQIALNEHESATLAALRNTLLPVLLSGDITLKAAEKTVAEVV